MMKTLVLVLLLCGVAFGAGAFFTTTKACTNSRCATTEFKKLADSGDYKIIDIRTAEEYGTGHLKHAENIDWYQTEVFNKYLESLDKKGKYLIYCRTGNRSGKALEEMKAKGFTNVSDLTGGITAWKAANLPVIN